MLIQRAFIDGVYGFGSKMGEGWLLTAEMLELAETGFENIVCTQPFVAYLTILMVRV